MEVPRFAQEFTRERLSIEPSVPRRPGASRDADTLTLRITDGDFKKYITLHSDEIDVLVSFLPHIARGMRMERLYLQCQDYGMTPVQNEVWAALCQAAEMANDEAKDAVWAAMMKAPSEEHIGG